MMRFRLQNIICVGIFSVLFGVNLVQTRLRPSDGCRDKDGVMHNVGNIVETANPCETACICQENGEVICAMIDCPMCVGIFIEEEGSCCGRCDVSATTPPPVTGCEAKGISVEVGPFVDPKDKCNSCECHPNGTITCSPTMCIALHCSGDKSMELDSQCCPVCYCEMNDEPYFPGDIVETDDPCMHCECGVGGELRCSTMACTPCQGQHVPVEGSCCGECEEMVTQPMVEGCERGGQIFEEGPFIDPNNKCMECECMSDGNVECDRMQCPRRLPCKKSLRVRPKGQCCKTCACVHNGQRYMPGPFEDGCRECVCENGKVTCNSPECPDVALTCTDPEMGEDCCPFCPNEATCSIGKRVIRYGEYLHVGKKICTCAGETWFPNAFCASKKVDRKFLSNYGQYLANYAIPKK